MCIGDRFTDPGGNTQNNITTVDYYISLAPGANAIDLTEMVVRWQHGSNLTDLTHSTTTPTQLSDGFTVQNVKEAEGTADNVLEEGDRVRVQIVLNGGSDFDESIGVRSTADVLFIPELGSTVDASFSTPPSFSSQTYISLK
jgi:archaellin